MMYEHLFAQIKIQEPFVFAKFGFWGQWWISKMWDKTEDMFRMIQTSDKQ
jgi:hypothetical protein